MNNISNEDFINAIRLGRGINISAELIVGYHNKTIAVPMEQDLGMYGDSNGTPQSIKVIDNNLLNMITQNESKVFLATRYFNHDYIRYVRALTYEDFEPGKAMRKALYNAPDIGAAISFGWSYERYIIAKAFADRDKDDNSISKLARVLNVAASTIYRTEREPSTFLKKKIASLGESRGFYGKEKKIYDLMKNFDENGYDDYGYARLAKE